MTTYSGTDWYVGHGFTEDGKQRSSSGPTISKAIERLRDAGGVEKIIVKNLENV